MTNSILKYDTIETKRYCANDYTSKDYSKICNIPELGNTDWIDYIEVQDNQTIESIAFNLYGSSDFWDILLIINNMDPLFDMPYDFDIIDTKSTNTILDYLSGYSGTYKSDTFDRLKNLMLDSYIELNEKNRMIKIIKPHKIYDFIKLIKNIV